MQCFRERSEKSHVILAPTESSKIDVNRQRKMSCSVVENRQHKMSCSVFENSSEKSHVILLKLQKAQNIMPICANGNLMRSNTFLSILFFYKGGPSWERAQCRLGGCESSRTFCCRLITLVHSGTYRSCSSCLRYFQRRKLPVVISR